VKTWKKRYFTVKKKPAKDGNGDKEEWILEYKETESATLPINAIPLETTTEFKVLHPNIVHTQPFQGKTTVRSVRIWC
jgi:hypothetical protein